MEVSGKRSRLTTWSETNKHSIGSWPTRKITPSLRVFARALNSGRLVVRDLVAGSHNTNLCGARVSRAHLLGSSKVCSRDGRTTRFISISCGARVSRAHLLGSSKLCSRDGCTTRITSIPCGARVPRAHLLGSSTVCSRDGCTTNFGDSSILVHIDLTPPI